MFDGNASGRKIYVFSDCVDTYKAGWSDYADYMPARKAYLLLDGGAAPASELTMAFDDETTGVAEMEDVRGKMEDVWYTINGVKLNGKPTKKGLYIVNGKKVVIK